MTSRRSGYHLWVCLFIYTSKFETFGCLLIWETLDLRDSNWKNCRALFAAELPSLKTLELGHCTSLKSDDVEEIGLSSLGMSFHLHITTWTVWMFVNLRDCWSSRFQLGKLSSSVCSGITKFEDFEFKRLHVIEKRRRRRDWVIIFRYVFSLTQSS